MSMFSEKLSTSGSPEKKPKSNKYELEEGISVSLDQSAQVNSLPSDRDPSLNYDEPENDKFEIIIPVTRFDANSDNPLLRDGQWLDYSLKIEVVNGSPKVVSSSMIDKRSFGENNPVYYQIHEAELDKLLGTEIVADSMEYIQSFSS